MKLLLIDIGATYTKYCVSNREVLFSVRRYPTGDFSELMNQIMLIDGQIDAIYISLPGIIDPQNNVVVECHNLPWLKGDIVERISSEVRGSPIIRLFNDGIAHAYSFTSNNGREKGLLVLSVGSAVAMNLFDSHGVLSSNLHGENWEINQYKILDSETGFRIAIGHIITNSNLEILLKKYGDKGYEKFGELLGVLISDLITIFAPKTIGLSGGVIVHNWGKLNDTVDEQINSTIAYHLPKIIVAKDNNSALLGLMKIATQHYPIDKL